MMGGYKIKTCNLLAVVCLIFLLGGCFPGNSKDQSNEIPINNEQLTASSLSGREDEIKTYTNAADLIVNPNKIIYYHQGTKTVIEQDNEKFNNIVQLIKTRASTINDICKLALTNSKIEEQKQNNDVIEFVYSRNIVVNWSRPNKFNNNFLYQFDYNSILFPLTGDWNKFMIFLPIQNGPLDNAGTSDELLKYLNQ